MEQFILHPELLVSSLIDWNCIFTVMPTRVERGINVKSYQTEFGEQQELLICKHFHWTQYLLLMKVTNRTTNFSTVIEAVLSGHTQLL
jgi:hypothetical protein